MSPVQNPLLLKDAYPAFPIGPGTYGDLRILSWYDDQHHAITEELTIGNYSSFGYRSIVILGGQHRTDWATTYPFPALWECAAHIPGHPKPGGTIHIGSDVWTGAETMIMSGADIGHGVAVAARSCVDRPIPPYAKIAGFPARIVGYRFSESTIARLLAIKWWDWPRTRIEKALPFMLSPNVEDFLSRVENGTL